MLNLEDQIKELADYSFESSEPVQFEPGAVASSRGRGFVSQVFVLAAAFALIVGAIAVSRLVGNGQIETVGDTQLIIDDPLDINLDSLIATSEQVRINSLGEFTTFNFDQLPEGWSAEQINAITVSGERPQFLQSVTVNGPGFIELHLRLEGALDGSPIFFEPGVTAPRQPNVNTETRTVSWIENGTTQVEISVNQFGLATTDDALELAELLVPVVAKLDWQSDLPVRSGSVPTDLPTQLSGSVDGISWVVVLDNANLKLLASPEFADLGGGPPRIDPPDPANILYTFQNVGRPGGEVMFGHAPDNVQLVRLNVLNGTVDLPVVAYGKDRVAFAVPIADRLDPTSVEFLDVDGNLIEIASLLDRLPYSS